MSAEPPAIGPSGSRPLHEEGRPSPQQAARLSRQFQALFLMEMMKPLTEGLTQDSLSGAGAGSDILSWFWQEGLAGKLSSAWPLPTVPLPGVTDEAVQGGTLPFAPFAGAAARFLSLPNVGKALTMPRPDAAAQTLPPGIPTVSAPAQGGGSRPALHPQKPPRAHAAGEIPPASGSESKDSSAAHPLERLIERASRLFELPVNLVRAVIHAESSGRPDAVSSKGAVGLMQVLPATASEMGVQDPSDPWQNLYAGAKYLSRQLSRFGSLEKALAAYNAGPEAVQRHQGVPPYPETRTYIQRVLQYKARLDGERPQDA